MFSLCITQNSKFPNQMCYMYQAKLQFHVHQYSSQSGTEGKFLHISSNLKESFCHINIVLDCNLTMLSGFTFPQIWMDTFKQGY